MCLSPKKCGYCFIPVIPTVYTYVIDKNEHLTLLQSLSDWSNKNSVILPVSGHNVLTSVLFVVNRILFVSNLNITINS